MSTLIVVVACVLAFLLFGGLVWLIVQSVITAQRRAAERRQALAGLAYHREWDYRTEDTTLTTRFPGSPFGRGHGRRAVNVVTGEHDDRPFVAFDYNYTTSNGETSTQHEYSILAMNLGTHAPDLSVGPTTTMRRWIDGLTGADVEIGDPAFDEHFTVHSPVPEFARELLLSDVRDVMRHHPMMSWRITGDSLLLVRSGEHSPGEVEAKLHIMDALLDRIPHHVWDRLRGEQPH